MQNITLSTKEICEKIEFPKEAIDALAELEKQLNANSDFLSEFNNQISLFLAPNSEYLGVYDENVKQIAIKYSVNNYLLRLLYVIKLAPYTLCKYIEKGLPEDLFWEGLKDLKYKLLECIECKKVPGTFVAMWNDGFLRVDRFTLGRFQYEPNRQYHGEDLVFPCGYVLKDGDKFIDFHIPSSGEPLTDNIRNDSYQKAFDFFKNQVVDDILVLHTHSWLVFPKNRDYMPKTSNILRFMDDFFIVNSHEQDKFEDAWRIFGAEANLPYEQLPEKTSLQKAMKNWLLDGNKCGWAEGFIVLHKGKNVTKIKNYFN